MLGQKAYVGQHVGLSRIDQPASEEESRGLLKLSSNAAESLAGRLPDGEDFLEPLQTGRHNGLYCLFDFSGSFRYSMIAIRSSGLSP